MGLFYRIPNAGRWTKSAMDCYMRGCICKGCPIYEIYCKSGGWIYRMKTAVLELVTKFGVPEELKKSEMENLLNE